MNFDDDGEIVVYTCFDVGMSGGCGVECPVLLTGGCKNLEKIGREQIIKFWGHDDAEEIFEYYPPLPAPEGEKK